MVVAVTTAEHQMGYGILHAQQGAQGIRDVDILLQDAGSQQADIEFANTASISSDWSGVMAFISYRLLAEAQLASNPAASGVQHNARSQLLRSTRVVIPH